MNEFWNLLHPIDRQSLMSSLYFDGELGNLPYKSLPAHVRYCLIAVWNRKYKDSKHELQF